MFALKLVDLDIVCLLCNCGPVADCHCHRRRHPDPLRHRHRHDHGHSPPRPPTPPSPLLLLLIIIVISIMIISSALLADPSIAVGICATSRNTTLQGVVNWFSEDEFC